MTVRDPISELAGFDPDAEVRFLSQPSSPFEYTIAAVVEVTDQPPREQLRRGVRSRT